MLVRRGEVWWADDLASGRRPVLVLTRTEAVARLNEILVVPATTSVRRLPTEVELDCGDGMPEQCVLTLDNLKPMPKRILIKRVTTLREEKLREVCRALAAAVTCDLSF